MNFSRTVLKDRNAKSPGAPTPKSPNVTILFNDDIVSSPVRDQNGVKMVGNYVLKPGASPITLYMTPSKQNPTFEGTGDEDSISILHKFEGMHPGDALDINELIQGLIGQNVTLISGNCQNTAKRVFGTKCAPLQLKPSYKADNDSTGHTLVFEQFQKTNLLPGHYEGELPTGNPTAVAANIVTASVDDGYQYKLGAFATTAALEVENEDLADGSFVTLIGAGGADPATLSQGAAAGDGEFIILTGGVDWTALDGATIDLEVKIAGDTTYLIERKRT